MTKHLADHRTASTGSRLRHFRRIARENGESMWHGLWQRPFSRSQQNRRAVEYVRIAKERKL